MIHSTVQVHSLCRSTIVVTTDVHNYSAPGCVWRRQARGVGHHGEQQAPPTPENFPDGLETQPTGREPQGGAA